MSALTHQAALAWSARCRPLRSVGHWLRVALAVLTLGSTAAARAAPLTLAIADTPLFAPALIAEAQGYYRSEGLDIKILHCVNGKRCLQHLTDGEAQVATVADTPIVMAAHTGARFDIIATMSTSRENRLIGRADRGIRTVADLKGKRIGFVKGTTGHYFTKAFLVFNNIDPGAVTLVPMEPGEMITQLVEGHIDAAGLYQPHAYYAAMKLGNNAVVLPSPRFYTVTANLVSVPTAAGLGDRELVKILRALKRACELIDAQPMQVKAILAARLHVDEALIEASWSDYEYSLRLGQSLITGLEAESRWALRESLVPMGPVPDYLERMRLAPLRYVDQRAVSIVK